MLAIGAAIAAYLVLRSDDVDAPATIVRTQLSDVMLFYTCPRQHTVRLHAGEAPHVCGVCGQLAFPRAVYRCPIHGLFRASLRMARDKDGLVKVSDLRLPGQPWKPVAAGLSCPQCQRKLSREPVDPLDTRKSRDDGGA